MPKFEKVSDDMLVSMINGEVSDVKTEAFDLISDQRINSNYSVENLIHSETQASTNMSKVKFYFTPMAVNTLVMHQSKVFCSDKETVKFSPDVADPGIIAGARQLEMAVNKVLHRDNPGFDIITEIFRSAAVNKMGIAKTTWGEEMEVFEETFSDIDTNTLAQIVMQKESEGYEVEITDEEVTETVQMIQEQDLTTGEVVEVESVSTTGSYTLKLSRNKGKIDVEVLPPEEFIINEDTTSIHNDNLTRYVGHKNEMYRSDVQELITSLGVKIDVNDLADYESVTEDYEREARHDFDGTLEGYSNSSGGTGANSKITIIESWIKADMDGDGVAEWIHAYTAGSTLIHKENWYGPIPFTSFTFFPVAHKFYGQSVFDQIHSYEAQATSLMRSNLDMLRLQNTFRLLAKDGSVDRRNLQMGKPGVIPVSNTFKPEDVMVVPSPSGNSGGSLATLEQLRVQVAGTIGIDPINGAISAKIEDSGNDAEKTAMAMDNATIKVEGYSRRFAEGALRDICWQIAIELVRNKDSQYVKELIDSVTPGQPFIAGELGFNKVVKKTDLVSQVGLGHMTGAQKIASSAALAQMIAQLEANPTPANYMLVSESMKGWGYEHPEEKIGPLEFYQQKAAELQQQQQVAMEAQMAQTQLAQQQMQIEQQKFEFEMQLRQQEQSAKLQMEQAETTAKVRKLEAEARKLDEETRLASQASAAEISVNL